MIVIMERRLPKTPREDSWHQHDIGESQRPNDAHANKRPIRDFDAYLRQIYEQQQLAMKADKEEQEKIREIVKEMTEPDGYDKWEKYKNTCERVVKEANEEKEQNLYQKEVDKVTKAQQQYNKIAQDLRKGFR